MVETREQQIEDLAYKLWTEDLMGMFNTNKVPDVLSKKMFLETDGHEKYFPRAEKVLEKKIRALSNKQYPVIEVPASGNYSWYGGAYVLCFVYSKYNGNFVLKGYHKEVEQYLEDHYTHYYCNFSLWCRGFNRDIWQFWKDGVGIFEPSKSMKRWKWEIRPYTGGKKDISVEESENKCLRFKRLPKRWIPEFDKL